MIQMNRRDFINTVGLGGAWAFVTAPFAGALGPNRKKLNVLLFTADDLNCDSVGCFGGKVPGLTPNLDAFASEGM